MLSRTPDLKIGLVNDIICELICNFDANVMDMMLCV